MLHSKLQGDLSSQGFATSIRRAACVAVFATFVIPLTALAHGGVAGDVRIDHPYATPSVPGASTGAAFIVALENSGKQTDRLLRASTPMAARTEMHTMAMDNGGVMRMREVADIAIAPGTPVKMGPRDGYHFMLMGLKQPLKEGDSFPMTLEFERGGKVDVTVIVQQPQTSAADAGSHKH